MYLQAVWTAFPESKPWKFVLCAENKSPPPLLLNPKELFLHLNLFPDYVHRYNLDVFMITLIGFRWVHEFIGVKSKQKSTGYDIIEILDIKISHIEISEIKM